MNLRPEEISSVIKEQIKRYKSELEVSDIGTVVQVAMVLRVFTDLRMRCRANFLNSRVTFMVWS